MKTVILCGGQGTRLQEATSGLKPKPMVTIGERPILWHIMKYYAAFGHREFVLCLGHLASVIKEYFLHYEAQNTDFTVELGRAQAIEYHHEHTESGWKVTLADTGLEVMTGARVARVQKYVGDATFMLTYGDGVADVDLDALLEFHRAHGRLATVTGVRPIGRFGRLNVERERVVSFEEKPAGELGSINGGFFVFEPGVFDYVTTDPTCILEREPLERLAADGQLMMYDHRGFWQCMDTVRDMNLLERLWQAGDPPWQNWQTEE
jgi:glucose-1-phosphate cytidylyltransferase